MSSIAERAIVGPDVPVTYLSTAILDVNLQFMSFKNWTKVMTMISKGSVNVLKTYSRQTHDGDIVDLFIHTGQSGSTGLVTQVGLPFIVSLNQYVFDPYSAFLRSNSPIATKKAILTRDNWTCAYQFRLGKVNKKGEPAGCVLKATTVDHIKPKCRGGTNEWENLVGACQWCNNHKADRTPEEAGMTLLFSPETYDGGRSSTEAEIQDFLMAEAGIVV